MPGVFDRYNQANSSVHRNQLTKIKCRSFAPPYSNYNYHHFHGCSGANSNSYISKIVGSGGPFSYHTRQGNQRYGGSKGPYGHQSGHGAVGVIKNDEEERKNFKKIGYFKMKSEVVVKADEMEESAGVNAGHLAEAKAKAEIDESKGVQVGRLEETSENLVVLPSRKRKLSSSTHKEKIFTQKEMIKSRGRCLVELDPYYTSHYDLQDVITSQKRPKNDKDMRLGVGAENHKHFRMPDEPIHFVRAGTFDSEDCLKFDPPPNFFYRKSKALQDLDWK